MTLYSTSTSRPSLSGPQGVKHHPFVAYIRVVPERGDGRRFVYYRDQEKIANRVEMDLLNADFNIATPVAWTPQFQNAPARLTIVGFVEKADQGSFESTAPDNRPPVVPEVKIIHSGTVDGEKTSVMTPIQGTQSWGDTPTAQNMADVADLKSALEAASPGIEVMYIQYQGVRYGQLPNKKGFFSFLL